MVECSLRRLPGVIVTNLGEECAASAGRIFYLRDDFY